jgi:predicted ester cyclase
MTINMAPEKVVRAWNDAYTRHDLDTALAFMSDDFVRCGEATNWAPMSKQVWGAIMREFFVAFPDWTWELTRLVASGDTVVCQFVERGTFTAPYNIMPGLTLPPNGKGFVDHDCDWFRVNEAGLITELRVYASHNVEATYGFSSAIRAFMAAKHS